MVAALGSMGLGSVGTEVHNQLPQRDIPFSALALQDAPGTSPRGDQEAADAFGPRHD